MDELREAFDDAWEESEGVEEEQPAAIEGESHEEEEATVTEDDQQPEPEKAGGVEEEVTEKPQEAVTKPPASWGAKAREDWEKVPAAAQAQIAKREGEVNQVLQQSAEARKAVDSFNNVLAPFREGLQAAGHEDPFTAISSVLQAESTLRAGSAFERAQGIANLINYYGVDVSALDGILSGQPQQDSPQSEMEMLIDQRMEPLNQFLHQQEQQSQYADIQQQQIAHQTVGQFGADKEFLNDVRMDMADLMDMAGKRGEQMTLDQAYEKACAINPQVSAVMAQRQTQQNIMGTNQNAQQKRAAAVSLTGTQGGAGGANGALSLRDTIAQAWNDQSG